MNDVEKVEELGSDFDLRSSELSHIGDYVATVDQAYAKFLGEPSEKNVERFLAACEILALRLKPSVPEDSRQELMDLVEQVTMFRDTSRVEERQIRKIRHRLVDLRDEANLTLPGQTEGGGGNAFE
jgi:hypothetical protein